MNADQLYYRKLKADPIRLRHLRDIQNLSRKKQRINARQRLIESLGSECTTCKFSDWRALQIDHVFSDGHIERKKRRSLDVLGCGKKIRDGFASGQYQLLCANCNWIKRHELKEDGSKQRWH